MLKKSSVDWLLARLTRSRTARRKSLGWYRDRHAARASGPSAAEVQELEDRLLLTADFSAFLDDLIEYPSPVISLPIDLRETLSDSTHKTDVHDSCPDHGHTLEAGNVPSVQTVVLPEGGGAYDVRVEHGNLVVIDEFSNAIFDVSLNEVSGVLIEGSSGDDSVSLSGSVDFFSGCYLFYASFDSGHFASRFGLPITFNGNDGDDVLTISPRHDPSLLFYEGPPKSIFSTTFNGGSGNDSFIGGNNGDWFNGGSGNDSALGGQGNDTLFGGTGDDSLSGESGRDLLRGGGGSDIADGGSSDDTLIGAGGDDSMYGGLGNDFLNGNSGRDSLAGEDGNDTVLGGAGTDRIDGGAGDDLVNGQGGQQDIVAGGGGADILHGGLSDIIIDGPAPELPPSPPGATGIPLGIELPEDGELVTISLVDTRLVISSAAGNIADVPVSEVSSIVITGSNADDSVRLDESLTTFVGTVSFNGGDGDDLLDSSSTSVNTVFRGGRGNDSLTGGSGIDIFDGADGDDFASGGGGNDRMTGGTGNDIFIGGRGNDVLNGQAGNDSLFGSAGQDSLLGGADTDFLNGGDGDDVVNGQGGNFDIVVGGQGADSVRGGSNDSLVDGPRDGEGTIVDTTFFAKTPISSGVVTVMIEKQLLRFFSSDGTLLHVDHLGTDLSRLVIDGQDSDDHVVIDQSFNGFDGEISINGSGGNDILDTSSLSIDVSLDGGAGDDSITGGVGNDILAGGTGDDSLIGGAGNDSLRGNGGTDFLDGGVGDDLVDALGGDQDTVAGGPGDDTLVGDNSDILVSDRADEFGGDLINGTLIVQLPSAGASFEVRIDFSRIRFIPVDGSPDLLSRSHNGIQRIEIIGSESDDSAVFHASAASFTGIITFNGGPGNDRLDAGAMRSNLLFDGGEGDDTFVGGEGRDTVSGGAGNDTLLTGANRDNVVGGGGDDIIDTGGDVDVVSGGDGDDSITGGDGNDLLEGDSGSDTITGGNGNDTLFGGIGDDFVDGRGGDADTVKGGSGTDTVLGDSNDLVFQDGLIGGGLLGTTLTLNLPQTGGAFTVEVVDTRLQVVPAAGGEPVVDQMLADIIRIVFNGGRGDNVIVFNATLEDSFVRQIEFYGLARNDIFNRGLLADRIRVLFDRGGRANTVIS